MIWARFVKSFTKTGVAALALAALATAGNAGEAYKGKFTLAAKTQWGDVITLLLCHPGVFHTGSTSMERRPTLSSWPLPSTKQRSHTARG
jgi:hypothetical protein